jgi:large conductance mechanosensitive channel
MPTGDISTPPEDINKVVSKELQEFKKFAFQSNMIQMAVSFILGASLKTTVTSISENLIMPFINYAIGKTGVGWKDFVLSPSEGIDLNIGKFCGNFLDFLITAFILYLIYIKLFKGKIDESRTKN